MIKSLLESLREITIPAEDGGQVGLEKIAVLEPHLIWLNLDSSSNDKLRIAIYPVSETYLFIEVQLVLSNGTYRQALAITNNPRHIIETLKAVYAEAKLKRKLLKCRIGSDETTSKSASFEIDSIIVPEDAFNKWYQIVYNKDTLVIFDTTLIEVDTKSVTVREYNDVFKLILSSPPWGSLFKVLIEILENSSNVKKRVVRAVRHGKGYTVAIGKPDSTEYKRYKIPCNGKNIILLVPEED